LLGIVSSFVIQNIINFGPPRREQITARAQAGALLADKGYNADAIRADLAERRIEAVIPGKSNCRVKIEHDLALYKQRNRAERRFGHLKINQAIATRYDQLANSFLGVFHLATARY
jgi:transposase